MAYNCIAGHREANDTLWCLLIFRELNMLAWRGKFKFRKLSKRHTLKRTLTESKMTLKQEIEVLQSQKVFHQTSLHHLNIVTVNQSSILTNSYHKICIVHECSIVNLGLTACMILLYITTKETFCTTTD
jgi:hypothetical protein